MEEEKENEEKLNGPSRFTETKLEKGVACVTCNRRRYTNEEKLNVLMGLHRPRKQNKRKRVACVSFRPSATRWHTAARATNRNPRLAPSLSSVSILPLRRYTTSAFRAATPEGLKGG